MGLPMVGIHSGADLSRTSSFGAYSAGTYAQKIFSDSSGNKYIVNTGGPIFKYTKEGVILWQKTISGISIQDAVIDSSSNLHICGTGGSTGIIVKISSSGAIVWQKQYSLSGSINSGGEIHVSSAGNVYCGFWYGPSNNDYADLAMFNSSGALQWRLQITHPTLYYNCRPGGISTDSSGNVYMGAHTYNASFGWESYAVKVNSSGSVQWQRKIYHASDSIFISGGTVIDTAGNIYFFGFKRYRTIYLTKLDPSGNMLWQKQGVYNSDFVNNGAVTTDGTDVYVNAWGARSTDPYNMCWVLTFNSSGAATQKKQISFDGVSVYSFGLDVSTSHIDVAGYGPFKWDVRIPKNGTKTGTYQGIGHTLSYTTSDFAVTDSDGSITSGGLSISSIGTSVSDSSCALSDASGTYTLRKF